VLKGRVYTYAYEGNEEREREREVGHRNRLLQSLFFKALVLTTHDTHTISIALEAKGFLFSFLRWFQ